MIADHWPGASPEDVLDWDHVLVEDAIQIIRARSRYQLRTAGRSGGGIDGRTGIPLE